MIGQFKQALIRTNGACCMVTALRYSSVISVVPWLHTRVEETRTFASVVTNRLTRTSTILAKGLRARLASLTHAYFLTQVKAASALLSSLALRALAVQMSIQ